MRPAHKRVVVLVLCGLLLTLFGQVSHRTLAAPPTVLAVAAAADLRYALDELAQVFGRQRPDIRLQITYGSSGNFFAQLSNRAPFDMFFSADIAYPQKLAERGLVLANSQFSYALGRLVLWVPRTSPIDLNRLGMKALLHPAVRKISIANPLHAPYGRAAEAAMKQLGVYDAVKDKLVLGENVSQAAQFVQTGAAEVGVIALSLALAPPMAKDGQFWEVPPSAYPRLEQAAVTLHYSKVPEAARAFQAYFTSQEGRQILARYGFQLPAR